MPETDWNADYSLTDYSGDVLIQLDEKLYAGLIACGIQIEKYAKKLCPVDTGRLRNSITYSVKTQPANMSYSWGDGTKTNRSGGSDVTASHGGEEDRALYVGTNVEYAEYRTCSFMR